MASENEKMNEKLNEAIDIIFKVESELRKNNQTDEAHFLYLSRAEIAKTKHLLNLKK